MATMQGLKPGANFTEIQMLNPYANASYIASQYEPSYLAEWNGDVLINTGITFIVLQTFFVISRLIARRMIGVKWSWTDLLVVLGLLFNIGVDAISMAMVTKSVAGMHQVVANLYPDLLVTWTKLRLAVSIIYFPAVVLPKLAILMLYLRIFPTKFVRWGSWITIAILVLNMMACMIAQGTVCRPITNLWEAPQKCLQILTLYQWSSFANIVTDVFMIIIPVPSILQLRMSWKVRIGVIFTFMTGSIGIVAACFRFAAFATISSVADGSWAATLLIWTMTECGTYLIAACLCTMRPLVEKARNLTTSLTGSRSKGSYGSSDYSKRQSSNGISKTTTIAVSRSGQTTSTDDFIPLKEVSDADSA